MRRHIPWWVLALLFVVVPIAEIYLLIQIGQTIGAWWTVLLLVVGGVLGSYLLKREGSRAWQALQESLRARRMPARELADGALILFGGTLLLTPGFLSDFVGLFCILPPTRPLARRALVGVITRRLAAGSGQRSTPARGTQMREAQTRGAQTRRGTGPDESVIQGEVVND
ncbi:hypothetical protein BH18ACT9_BH18ACT9_11360 [soil metagenome]